MDGRRTVKGRDRCGATPDRLLPWRGRRGRDHGCRRPAPHARNRLGSRRHCVG